MFLKLLTQKYVEKNMKNTVIKGTNKKLGQKTILTKEFRTNKTHIS